MRKRTVKLIIAAALGALVVIPATASFGRHHDAPVTAMGNGGHYWSFGGNG